MTPAFDTLVVASLPRLQRQALALTRNHAAADDLVQDSICNALTSRETFIPGTNFNAWITTVVRNRFIAGLRRRRDTVDIDDVPEEFAAVLPDQEHRLVARDLALAFDRLPRDMAHALTAIAVDGNTYEELSQSIGCAVGTVKSRVFRARVMMKADIEGVELSWRQMSERKPRRAPVPVLDLHGVFLEGPAVSWFGGDFKLSATETPIMAALMGAAGKVLHVNTLAVAGNRPTPLVRNSVGVAVSLIRRKLRTNDAPVRIVGDKVHGYWIERIGE